MNDEESLYEADIYGLPVSNQADISHGRDPLEVLASEFVEALRRGESPGLEEYVTRYPKLAVEIRETFPLLAAMEKWKGHKERASFDHRSLEILQNDRFGDFRILREIGRGGMGIVFEAEQKSGGLRVAVKVLPFIQETSRRTRFEAEARTAAQLRHPRIVPVYSYGVHEGVCYYVMRLVEGVGLDWIIQCLRRKAGIVYAEEISARFAALARHESSDIGDQGGRKNHSAGEKTFAETALDQSQQVGSSSSPRSFNRDSWQQIAKIGAQVADAMDHAHSNGILHRDIKPANLLLDSNGSVWITDFGLAQKSEELLKAEGSGLSGTLRYMAPEQFGGQVDARCDIYSLGITLFELLTRLPAFPAVDRSRLVETVGRSSLPKPREVNPKIPRDLEAIVVKATANDPARRYTSAAALRSDLLRFLKGERVAAKRVSRWPTFRWKSP